LAEKRQKKRNEWSFWDITFYASSTDSVVQYQVW
jgi:hypothetical protein